MMFYEQIAVNSKDIANTLNSLSKLKKFELIQILPFFESYMIIYKFNNPRLEDDYE